MKLKSLLCVCTGNICRSPLAEGLFRREMPALTMGSAGIGAVVGGCMPQPAQDIAAREGLDLAHHRGRQVTASILHAHELVLTTEDRQKRWLAECFPESRGRLFMLSHWRGGADITDPYRQSMAVFETIYAELVECVADWTRRLDG